LPPNSVTLHDFECQNRGLIDFLEILGCVTRCRHTANSLCNADGDFGSLFVY